MNLPQLLFDIAPHPAAFHNGNPMERADDSHTRKKSRT
jgi:hypothetical protein